MTSGDFGGKFVLTFTVQGDGQKQLEDIAGRLSGMSNSLGHSATEGNQLAEIFDRISDAGEGLISIGEGILHSLGGALEHLIERGGEFENQLLRIQGAGKTREEAHALLQDTMRATQELPITEQQALTITTALATKGVEATQAFGKTYEELAKTHAIVADLDNSEFLNAHKGKGPTALSLVGDLLAAQGQLGAKDADLAIREFSEYLASGNAAFLRTRFALVRDELKKAGKDTAKQLEVIYEYLEKKHALGLSVAASMTFSGVMSFFRGLPDQITNAVMQPGVLEGLQTKVNQSLLSLYHAIMGFFDEGTEQGKKFLGALRDIGTFLADSLIRTVDALKMGLKGVFTFIADHPLLVKFALVFTTIGAAVLTAVGAFLVFTGTIAGLVVAISTLGEVLTGVLPVAILASGAAFIVLAGAIGVAYAAYKAYEADFAGIKTLFEDVGVVINAVREAFDDMSGDLFTVSEETYNKLQARGLYGIFMKVMNIIRSVQVFYEQFMARIHENGDAVLLGFKTAWDKVSDAVGRVIDAGLIVIGIFTGGLGTGKESVEEAGTAGAEFADKVLVFAEKFADFVDRVATGIDAFLGTVPEIIDNFATLLGWVIRIKNWFILAKDVGVGLFHLLIAGAEMALNPIITLANAVMALGKAFHALKEGRVWDAVSGLGKDIVDVGKGALGRAIPVGQIDKALASYENVPMDAVRIASGGENNAADKLHAMSGDIREYLDARTKHRAATDAMSAEERYMADHPEATTSPSDADLAPYRKKRSHLGELFMPNTPWVAPEQLPDVSARVSDGTISEGYTHPNQQYKPPPIQLKAELHIDGNKIGEALASYQENQSTASGNLGL